MTKISILAPSGEIIGSIGSLVKDSETNEYIVYECTRFCFNNNSIAEFYKSKKKFSFLAETSVRGASKVEKYSVKQDNCFIRDHSFCFTPSVSDKVKVKAYKNPSYNTEDIETYERWLESTFVW